MTGFLLHLAGPLQSWGTNSAWHHRDTHTHPTRSGITGLLAAAAGTERGTALTHFDALTYTIRVDRPGRSITDYHTVGTVPRSVFLARHAGLRSGGMGTVSDDI